MKFFLLFGFPYIQGSHYSVRISHKVHDHLLTIFGVSLILFSIQKLCIYSLYCEANFIVEVCENWKMIRLKNRLEQCHWKRFVWWLLVNILSVGHFRVPKTLTFKKRPSTQPFLWKRNFFARVKNHSYIKGYRGKGNSKMAYECHRVRGEAHWTVDERKEWLRK